MHTASMVGSIVALGLVGLVVNESAIRSQSPLARGDGTEIASGKQRGHPHHPEAAHTVWTHPPFTEDEAAIWHPASSSTNAAYVTYLGNDKYLDGALVLGHSLRHHSRFLESDRCSAVILIGNEVTRSAASRLSLVFDDIKRVNESDAFIHKEAKGSKTGGLYTTTLDKLFIYNLTEYSVVAFLDADIVILKNPDSIFNISLPKDPHWIAAVHGHSSSGYFHTGAMLMRPSHSVLDELSHFFQKNVGLKKYGFDSQNIRDGLIMRYFVNKRVVPMGRQYSAQQSMGKTVVGLHLSGTWKPWFNRCGDRKETAAINPTLRSPVRFGSTHNRWWQEYEAFHQSLSSKIHAKDKERFARRWHKSEPDATTKTHMWMMRGTEWEYLQRVGTFTQCAISVKKLASTHHQSSRHKRNKKD